MSEVEAIVEPDCITDDVGWKSVALIGIHQLILANAVVNLAVPLQLLGLWLVSETHQPTTDTSV